MPFKLIKAEASHLAELVEIISQHSKKDEILPRNESNIRHNLDEFSLVIDNNKVIACASIQVYSKDLAEIRSLVVSPDYQGQGVGKDLVHFVEQSIKNKGIENSFVLTRSIKFFEKQGYVLVNKSLFPEKIWNDCINCPHISACDEAAMQKTL